MGKIQKEILCLLKESQSDVRGSFSSQEFESKIPHEMRWKEWDVVTDNSGNTCLYWVTQQYYSKEQLEQFKKVLSDLYGDVFNCAFVIVRDDSTYDFYEDSTSGRGDFITLGGSVNESVLTEKINKDNIEVNKILANPNAGKNAERIRDMGYETNVDSNGRIYSIRNPKTGKVIFGQDYNKDEKGKVDFKGKLDSTRPEMKKTLRFWDDDIEKVPKSQSIGRNKSRGSLNGNRVYDYEEQLKRIEGISKNIKDYKKAVSDKGYYKNHLSRKEKDIADTERKIKDAQDELKMYKRDIEDTKKSIDNAEARRKDVLNRARNKKVNK